MLKILRPDSFSISLILVIVIASIFPGRGAFGDVLQTATRAAITLLFFMHGAKLSREAILRGMGAWRLHVSALAITFVFFPLLAVALTMLPDQLIKPEIKIGILFLSVVPATVQSSVSFTSIAGGNVAAAVCNASLSNILGVFLTPLLAGLLIRAFAGNGGVDTATAIQTVVLTLLVPFIVGHLSRPLIASFVDRHKSALTLLDRGAIILVVYSAFGASVIDGLWSRVSGLDLFTIVAVSIAMLTAALLISVFAARVMHMSRPDEAALVFCASKKSLASGVPIAAALYPAAMVGIMILPLMIFHLIQLIVCAAIARAYAQQNNAEQRAEAI